MKNIVLNKMLASVVILTLLTVAANAQLTNCNVFLQGNYVELGINTNGAFGSSVAAPAGYHPRGGISMQNTCDNSCSGISTLGFVADPAKDGWTIGNPAYFGDYFMPGSPQEGWSIKVDGVQSNAWNGLNAKCGSNGQFTGSLSGNNASYTSSGRIRTGTWQGQTSDNISITQVTTLDTANLFFTVTVTLKNTGGATKNNIYYMRTVDPDNDQTLSGKFRTINTIAYQLPNANNRTLVTATGSVYTQAYVGLGTLDCRAKCFYVNANVIPPADCDLLYAGTAGVSYSGSLNGDVAIGLVFNVGSLGAGDSTTLSYAYVLNASYLDIAFPLTDVKYSASGDTAVSHATGDTAHICQYHTTTVNIENGSNFTWAWSTSTGDTLSSTTGNSVDVNMHGARAVLTAVGTPLCSGPSNTINIVLDPSRPLPADPVATSNSPQCAGNTLNLSATSTAGATFSWTGAASFTSASQSPSIANAATTASGTYTVSASLNGCNALNNGSVAVTVNALPVVSAITGTSSICANTTTTFSNTTSGGVWSSSNTAVATVSNTGLVSGVSTGSATITYTVTDVSGCSSFVTKSISVNQVPTVAAIVGTDSTCVGFSSTLTSTTSGGVWSSSDPSIVSVDPVTGVFTGVAVGTANITYSITNNVGCTSNSSIGTLVNPVYTITTLPISNGTISPSGNIIACSSEPLSFSFTPNAGYHVSDILVDGVSLGSGNSFTFTSVSAPHNIQVLFTPDCVSPAITVCPGNVNQNTDANVCSAVVNYTGATATGTSPVITYTQNAGTAFSVGTTTVTATATNACGTDNCSFTVTVTDNQHPSITAPADVTVNADPGVCLAASVTVGAATATDNCGIASITNNAALPFVVGTTVVTWTATDVHGNTSTATQNVVVVDNQNPTITAPANVSVNADAASCVATGVSLGAPTVSDNCDIGNITNNAPSSFPVGNTTVTWTVTDIHGHSATATQSVTVNPNVLAVTATHTNVSCHGGNNGTITTSVSGGTGNYAYSWTGGASGANPTNLAAGTYTVTVTDNGCQGTAAVSNTVTITDPAALAVSATAANVSCNSSNGGAHSDGSIATSVSGGTGNYSYAWTGGASGANPSNLSTGTYTVTVTDANSCTVSTSATVGQPNALSATATATDVSCGNNANGSIATSVSGGTSPYSYAWTGGASGANPSGLTQGTYNLTVTDAHSCTTTGAATVGQSGNISSTISGSATVLGSVTTTYTGPAGMSTYSWSISGGDHVCDSKCHHNSDHTCGSGCDHYGHACSSACHHNAGHSCTSNHTGDHHCNSFCHHNNGHVCAAGCDHYGQSCTSACHHHNSHRCGHQHCGAATISGSATSSSVSVVSPCCSSTYTLTLTTTNGGNCTSSSSMAITSTASATITVYSTLYTTGSGNHPGVTKSALAATLKVYDRHTVGARNGNQSNYSTIWNSTNGLISNISISDPVSVNMGGGPAYRYIITVPAYGHYLVIGQSQVSSNKCGGSTCTVYTGRKVGGHEDCDGNGHDHDDDDDGDVTACSNTVVRYHTIMKDQTGKCTEGDTHQEHGSLMLVVSPMALEFTDSVSYLPVVYESVEGDWDVTVSADPPYGFYTDPADVLSTSVTDSVMNAVQFAVIDTGSEWTFTQLNHSIQHKGESRTAKSKPVMVNNRTNKPTQINVVPNPADDQIKIIMANFEGKATVYIYNLLGQKVAEQPINSISGASVSMDISSLAPGVYLITAENSSGKASGRFIKNTK